MSEIIKFNSYLYSLGILLCMDIYEEIVDLLGLDSNSVFDQTDLDEVESSLLDKLNNLNSRFRSIQKEIEKIDNKTESLRNDVAYHNKKATEAVRRNDEGLARHHLEKKEKKMDKINSLETQLSDLRESKQKIDDKRVRIEEKLIDIREMKRN